MWWIAFKLVRIHVPLMIHFNQFGEPLTFLQAPAVLTVERVTILTCSDELVHIQCTTTCLICTLLTVLSESTKYL